MIEKHIQLKKKEWVLTRLGDVAQDINDRVSNPSNCDYDRFVGLENFVSGELKISRWGSTKGLTSAAKLFTEGDVLFARRNAYLKRSSLVDFKGVCSGDAFVLRSNSNLIVPGFLAFILNSDSLWKYAISHAAGTMSKRVKWRDLMKYEFLLPSKEMQSIISELIWSSNKSLEKSYQVKELLSIQSQSIFKERCSLARGDNYKVMDLLNGGPKNGFSPKGNSTGDGYQTVSISSVKNGRFDVEGNIKYAVVDESVLDKFDVKKNDIFIVRGNGNRTLCGKAGISFKDHSNLFYPDLLIRLRFDNTRILPEFAAYQWNTLKTHMKLLQSAKSTNGIWKVNGDDIKRHKLFVPSISVQKSIMNEVAAVSKSIDYSESFISNSHILQNKLINEIF